VEETTGGGEGRKDGREFLAKVTTAREVMARRIRMQLNTRETELTALDMDKGRENERNG
jgi:hypothetical protein